jgi:hypothetical protein
MDGKDGDEEKCSHRQANEGEESPQ